MENRTQTGRGLRSSACRCREFSGKPDQSLQEFTAEHQQLSQRYRLELCDLFNKAGMPTQEPALNANSKDSASSADA
jgi:hypothetical protein